MIEFKEWPKTPRLNRDMIVTEKIDGTNAAVIIQPISGSLSPYVKPGDTIQRLVDFIGPIWVRSDEPQGIYMETSEVDVIVAAQSRKRLITPGKTTDNAGFAAWVYENAKVLAETLGEGYHYGEWWGKGIQTGYGLRHKRFSLFNVVRYAGIHKESIGLDTVPILYEGPFCVDKVNQIVDDLRINGSKAVIGQKAEGVVVFHTASNSVFKVTCEKDETYKGNQ